MKREEPIFHFSFAIRNLKFSGILPPALCLVTSCSTQQRIPIQNRVAISPASGAVSGKLVPDPNAPEVLLGPDEEFVKPRLRPENRPPAYPPELIPLHLPPHTIGVRLTFSESGRVIDAVPSPLVPSTDDSCKPAFLAAVTEAVREWKCQPPAIRKFRPGPDTDGDGKPDYQILVAQRVLKTFFDLSFSFEVVNGHPVVKSGW